MRIVEHREIPTDPCLRGAWNELVTQMESPEVFYTYEWALAVSRAYHASLVPLLLLAYEGESLVGVASLATDIARRKAMFLAHATADYCDFVSRPADRGALLQAAFAHLRKLHIPTLTMANFPADSATRDSLSSAGRSNGYSMFTRPAYECARVSFTSVEERESTAKSVRSKQMLRRHMKAMQKVGPVTVIHLESWDRISQHLPGFTRSQIARFLAVGRISNQASPERRSFLGELAGLLAQSGWMRLSYLALAGDPIAWNYGFQYQGSWFWYQPCFDTQLERYSPGYCLLARIIEDACSNDQVRMVDLGLGAEDYKERFANSSRHTLHVTATTRVVVRSGEMIRHYGNRAVASLPALERPVRRFWGRTSSLRDRIAGEGALSTLKWFARRCAMAMNGQAQVDFFEWREPERQRTTEAGSGTLSLAPVGLELLATAAMRYAEDRGTASYLLRAAQRLSQKTDRGYALLTSDGTPVHFCWVGEFERFYMSELDHRLSAPIGNSVLLFDCWTPAAVRGCGYYGVAISLLASQLRNGGCVPWIFSAATNHSSLRGIEKAGFVPAFSLVRKRGLLLSKLLYSRPTITLRRIAGSTSAG